MPYYASNLVLQQTFKTAGELGVPRQDMLDYLGVDETSVLRPGGMVPTPILLDAIEYGAQRSGRADFGLRLAAAMPEGIAAGLAILLSHCRTMAKPPMRSGNNSMSSIRPLPSRSPTKMRADRSRSTCCARVGMNRFSTVKCS